MIKNSRVFAEGEVSQIGPPFRNSRAYCGSKTPSPKIPKYDKTQRNQHNHGRRARDAPLSPDKIPLQAGGSASGEVQAR